MTALHTPPLHGRGAASASRLASLIGELRGCSTAESAAEALLDALADPGAFGARPTVAWVQLGRQFLVDRGCPEGANEEAWRWMQARSGPVLALRERGAQTRPPEEGWLEVTATWSGPATTLLWPLEAPSGAVAGAVALGFNAPLATSAWLPDPEGGQGLVDLASPRVLALPRRRPAPSPGRGSLLPVVGDVMSPIIATLEAYARTEDVLLLRGPTGTGKSRLATWCWSRSPRSGRKLVVANLLGVPDTGQDSELFGVRKGTFTGVGERLGQLQSAQHGTLFIDEVDKLGLQTQARLLRVLDERRYYVVGDPREHTADVRFIIASNSDLEAAVAERRFLEDLYYRINVMPVALPALRERPDEIGPWAQHMAMEQHTGRGGRHVTLSAEAECLLVERSWPGNLRQLHNVVRRAYAFTVLEAAPQEGDEVPDTLQIEGRHVQRALSSGASPDAPPDSSTLEALHRAATGLVNAVAQRRAAGVAPLSDRDGDLELADAFRGLVLLVAAERLGDTRKAFELFGLESRLRGGNHLRTWRLAHRQAATLRLALARGA